MGVQASKHCYLSLTYICMCYLWSVYLGEKPLYVPFLWPVTPKQYSNRTLPYTVIDIYSLSNTHQLPDLGMSNLP